MYIYIEYVYIYSYLFILYMYVCVGDAEFPCFAAHLHHNHWMVEKMYPAYTHSLDWFQGNLTGTSSL